MKIAAVYALVEETTFKAAVRAPLLEVLDLMHRLGFDGIEINIPDPFKVDVTKLSKNLKNYGLELSAISTGLSYVNYGLSLTHPSKEVRGKSIEFFIKYSEIASTIEGSNKVVIGLARGKSEGRQLNDVIQLLKESIRVVLEKTENNGTIFLLEPINKYETDIINTIDEALPLIKEYKRLKLLYDTYHMTIEDVSPYDAILKADGHIGYVHVAENNRLAPGMGMLDWERILYRLLRVGYNDYVSIEAIPKPSYEEMLRIGIRTLRSLLPKVI